MTAGAVASYGLLLASVLARPLLPAPDPEHDYAAIYGYATSPWIGGFAAALGLLSVLIWPRARIGRSETAVRGVIAVLCLWTSAGLVLDGFRFFFWSTGIPAGDFGLVDWRGAMTRAAGGLALVLTAVTMVRSRRAAAGRDGRTVRWPGFAAAFLACVYPGLKYYWYLGGTFARPGSYDEGVPMAETLLLVGGVTLSLLLVRGFHTRYLHAGMVAMGWLVTVVVINQGMLPLFGMSNYLLGGPRPSVMNDESTTWWVTAILYGSWAVLGVFVGIATLRCRRRTARPARSAGIVGAESDPDGEPAGPADRPTVAR